jgi:hypothetical protein
VIETTRFVVSLPTALAADVRRLLERRRLLS